MWNGRRGKLHRLVPGGERGSHGTPWLPARHEAGRAACFAVAFFFVGLAAFAGTFFTCFAVGARAAISFDGALVGAFVAGTFLAGTFLVAAFLRSICFTDFALADFVAAVAA